MENKSNINNLKEYLAEMAEKIVEKCAEEKNPLKISDTQIRNYMEAAKSSDNYKEYIVYLKYQGARNGNVQEFLNIEVDKSTVFDVLDKIMEKHNRNFKSARYDFSYFFGNIARCLKIYKKKEGDKNAQSKKN